MMKKELMQSSPQEDETVKLCENEHDRETSTMVNDLCQRDDGGEIERDESNLMFIESYEDDNSLLDKRSLNERSERLNCGIYRIICEVCERFYIGSSKHIDERWETHRWELRRKKGTNNKLQFCWDDHNGEKSFKCEILFLCDENQLKFYEQNHLDHLCNEFVDGERRCKRISLNVNPYADRFSSNKGRKHSEESRKNMSEAQKGKHHTDETKKKISAAQKGKIYSDETKKKLSESNKGKVRSNETKKKISVAQRKRCGKNHPMFGRKHTDEAKIKMSEVKKEKYCGEKHPMFGQHHTDETKKKISDSLVGRTPWNKGTPQSEETKKKLSEANKGKTHTQKTKKKMSDSHKANKKNICGT